MSKDIKVIKKPSKKKIAVVVGIVALLIAVYFIIASGKVVLGGGKLVKFEDIAKDDIPKSIERDVIPEYRELERALGCVIEDKVYVIVTRGEKESSGYEVKIDKMILEKKENKENLRVEASFKDPKTGEKYSREKTYPYAVALTDLDKLPDSIELIAKY